MHSARIDAITEQLSKQRSRQAMRNQDLLKYYNDNRIALQNGSCIMPVEQYQLSSNETVTGTRMINATYID